MNKKVKKNLLFQFTRAQDGLGHIVCQELSIHADMASHPFSGIYDSMVLSCFIHHHQSWWKMTQRSPEMSNNNTGLESSNFHTSVTRKRVPVIYYEYINKQKINRSDLFVKSKYIFP